MSSQNQEKTKVDMGSTKNAEKKTWMDRNLPTLVGGGTFGLLILLTVVMYFANS